MSTETSEEELTAVEVTHSPATVSAVLASVFAVLAVISSSTSLLALGLGAFGLVAVVGGLFVFDSERAMAIGTGIVFVGVVLSGILQSSLALLILGAFSTIMTFDLGQNAFSVGRQLSDDTQTVRGELVHAAASVAVGVVIVGVAAGIFIAAFEGLSVSSLAFLLLGALLLVWAIRQ